MWQPKRVSLSEIQREDFDNLEQGNISAIIIENFFNKNLNDGIEYLLVERSGK